MKNIYLIPSLVVSAGILMAGCGSSKQSAMLDTIGSPQTRPATFEALRADLRAAERDQVNLISPEKFMKAERLFEEAETMRSKSAAEDKYESRLEDARAELDSAIAFSKRNKDQLSPLIEAREITLNSGAAETTNKDLRSLEAKYLALVRDLDSRNKRARAMNRIPVLTEEYKQLTIKTLQAKHLGEANNNLAIAKREGAEELLPKTLQETEDTLKNAHNFIAENPNPESSRRITRLGNEATKASSRLLTLTREAQSSSQLSPEARILKNEDQRKSAQRESEARAKSSAQETARLEGSLAGSRERVSALETRTEGYERLEQNEERSKELDSVQGIFSEEEARVTRQGSNLIISLKKINFGINDSQIPTPSFELLKKVQTAINRFEQASVVVEGHTDSTGSSDLNEALSMRRAEAVKEYFVSNRLMPRERIEAVGFGSKKPLASNESSEGRAINRRIDIVIKN